MSHARFDQVPDRYMGVLVQRIKNFRRTVGRKSLAPTVLQIGELQILVPRHFGFCFGVERAIHMAFAALDKNPAKRTFMVSQIIHNPRVNDELEKRGLRFLFDSAGRQQIGETEIQPDDAVLIPAFGTTLNIMDSLQRRGIDPFAEAFRKQYDTTCPFVAKVWKRGEELGREGYTVVIHGKFEHEETQATRSHIEQYAKVLVLLDPAEAMQAHDFIVGKSTLEEFRARFGRKWSAGFDPLRHLERVAVVNQTTMLADQTQEVTRILRAAMQRRYGEAPLDFHFAATKDTLCYATNHNQHATRMALVSPAQRAVVVGGYNSSNTAHLVEICSTAMPSYLIAGQEEMRSKYRLRHFDIHRREMTWTDGWLPEDRPACLVVTSGASCPDILLNQVIEKLAGFYGYGKVEIETGLENLRLFEDRAAVPDACP